MNQSKWDRSLILKATRCCDTFKLPIIAFCAVAWMVYARKVEIRVFPHGGAHTTWIAEVNALDQRHDIRFQTYQVQSPRGISLCGSEEDLDIPCSNGCGNIAPLLNHLLNYAKKEFNPELYIIPLDGVALLRTSNFSVYEQALKETLNSVYNQYSFMRLGGANHVLLCLLDECNNVMLDVIKLHPMGWKSRAIWVGQKGRLQGMSQWACPDRVVVAPTSLIQALQLDSSVPCKVNASQLWTGVHDLLSVVDIMFSGKNTWQCDREKWDLNLGNASLPGKVFVDKKHKLAVCTIPKCGTTRLKMLLRRMTDQPDWEKYDGKLIHGNNGLEGVQDKEKLLELFQDPSWIKVAFIRHPAERLLSGYLNKIVYAKWYNVLDPNQKTEPSLQQVIDSLRKASKGDQFKRLDEHFRALHFFCGFKTVRYDFLGKTPNMGKDLEDLLASLALWHTYGASGWGKNKSLSVVDANVYKAPNFSKSKVSDMLSEKMLQEIFSIFHEDYELLDFDPLDVYEG